MKPPSRAGTPLISYRIAVLLFQHLVRLGEVGLERLQPLRPVDVVLAQLPLLLLQHLHRGQGQLALVHHGRWR